MARVTPLQMANALLAAGFTRVQIPTMVAIGLAESNGKTDALNHNRNGTEDVGVWQINSVHGYDRGELLTLTGNARAAKKVYDSQGYRAWVVYNTGAYKRHTAEARGTGEAASGGGGDQGSSANTDTDWDPRHWDISKVPWLAPFAFFAQLGKREFWVRVGMGAGAVLLLIFGVVLFARDNASGIAKAVLK